MNHAPLTTQERMRRAEVVRQHLTAGQTIPVASTNGGRRDDPLIECTKDELLPEPRTSEEQRAHDALHDDRGFASWERILAQAAPEKLPGILKNALVELYGVAKKAAVSHTEISDWGMHVGEMHNIGDADELQAIIAEARGITEKGRHKAAASARNVARLRPLDLKEFLQLSIKPRGMVLDPILPEKGLAMLYAARGTGKTHVALGIAYAVATGSKFLKWDAPKARRMLLIDGEMPAAALQERLASIVASAPDAQTRSQQHQNLGGRSYRGGWYRESRISRRASRAVSMARRN